MKILKLTVYYLLQMTWGILQNLLGFLVWIYVLLTGPKEERHFFYGALVTRWNLTSSMSLGMFLFLGNDDEKTIVHEYGHSIQSIILGPFYLLIIGIPSYCWANLPHSVERRKKEKIRYTSFYTEKWANHLGYLFTGKEPITY